MISLIFFSTTDCANTLTPSTLIPSALTPIGVNSELASRALPPS